MRRTMMLILGVFLIATSAWSLPGQRGDSIDVRLTDNGDDDGVPDSRETVSVWVTLRDVPPGGYTGVVAELAIAQSSLACVTTPTVSGSLIDGTLDVPLEFIVSDVQRTLLQQPLSVKLEITVTADQLAEPLLDEVYVDLDLDIAGGSGPTIWSEGFEDGFGAFTTMHLDEELNPPPGDLDNESAGLELADGARCQYHDPDWEVSIIYDTDSSLECFPNPNNEDDAFYWGPNTERAYEGSGSIHWGIFINNPLGYTSPPAQLEAIGTTEPVNLGLDRVCENDRTQGCAQSNDCAPGEQCVDVSPTLSFKHQISLMDHRTISARPDRGSDRGVVQVQLADDAGAPVSDWIKIYPYVTSYDTQAEDNYFNCTFDPTDDGSTEDDFFDPADPERRLGPSSTCFPEWSFAQQGDTFDAPLCAGECDNEFPGETGPGTWIQPEFSLTEFRGRRIRLRFLEAGLKIGSIVEWQEAFEHNPDPGDDGWFIDDVRITDALTVAASVVPDTKDNSGLFVPADSDGDGLRDPCDNCALDANPGQEDFVHPDNGIGDICDDPDGDSVADAGDNCPDHANTDQLEQDGDGFGDACDCIPLNPFAAVPGAPELHDGRDNSCPGDYGYGLADEIFPAAVFVNQNVFVWPSQPGAVLYQVAWTTDPDFNSCLTGTETDSNWANSTPPAPGELVFILVRAFAPSKGSWGPDSTGAGRAVPCAN